MLAQSNLRLYSTQCPRCAAQGGDTSGDNLHVYADGHEFCHACHKLITPAKDSELYWKYNAKDTATVELSSTNTVCGIEDKLPTAALAFLYKNRMTVEEITKYRIKWIASGLWNKPTWTYPMQIKNCLYIPTVDSAMIRCIDGSMKQKAYSIGPQRGWLATADSDTIALTEDVFSAAACSRLNINALALLSANANKGLKLFIDELIKKYDYRQMLIMLDPDEAGQRGAEQLYKYFRMKLDTRIVSNNRDPKYYSTNELRRIVYDS